MTMRRHQLLWTLLLTALAVNADDWNASSQTSYAMLPVRNGRQDTHSQPLQIGEVSPNDQFQDVVAPLDPQIMRPQQQQQQQQQLEEEVTVPQELPEDESLQSNLVPQTSGLDNLSPEDIRRFLEEKNELLEKIRLLEESNRNLKLTVSRNVGETRNATYKPIEPIDTLDSYEKQELVTTRPVDCADHLVLGATRSGVYDIYPFTCLCNKPVRVYCDMETDGGGWTVLLTRYAQESPVDFNGTWTDYKIGFGDPAAEYWIGNEYLHSMTTGREYTLRMDVELKSNLVKTALWKTITVDNEVNRFRLTLGAYSTESTTNNNCFPQVSGQFFSTYDRDYDGYSGNCAMSYGGFWHYRCSNVMHPTRYFGPGIPSNCYSYQQDTATFLQLKIRPSICGSTFKTVYLNSYDCDSCH